MKAILGRKQSIKNEDWIKALENIEEFVSREELEELTDITVKEIIDMTKGKKSAYGWSAGKDSIALRHICERAGIKDCFIGISNLEYPAFLNWIMENKSEECKIINTGQDIDWLSNHLEMLFPKDSKISSRWFSIVQHKAQRIYYKENELDILILGRRKADGNYVGRGSNIYTDRNNVTRFSPLSEWKHEHILAYIHYNRLTLPPIYDWHNGYKCGTHPWPARPYTPDITGGWKEIYDIDPSIVENAAEKIESAKEFMEGLNNGNY